MPASPSVFKMNLNVHFTLFLLAAIFAGAFKADDYVSGNFPLCSKYQNAGSAVGGSLPQSFHLETLKNNEAEDDEIFNGKFYVNPYVYGPNWISFKPVGDYAVGAEYRIVTFADRIFIGTVGKADCSKYLDTNVTNWFPIDIVLKKDGLVQVSLDDNEDIMECNIPGIVSDPPKFLEMKGIDSEIKEISVFYDCAVNGEDFKNEVEKI